MSPAEIRCPKAVADVLHAAGWRSGCGWWEHPLYAGNRRWYDAYNTHMKAPRKRRCSKTLDMLAPQ